MTRTDDTSANRLPDGSIDYRFYDARARRLRSADARGWLSMLIGKPGRVRH